ncbi:LysR family transcriptional regulator [Georgenia halophila]|uniref:LysR family transcriptional regulator n=1 Tax=Georgenia halophila TaxID=620889 RepID=A0ABP8KSX0_9MICO
MLAFGRLVVLRAVAEHGSMTKAAEELSFSPSAVSQQITALERQAGTALVVRHARGVHLTEAGQRLAEHAEAMLERLRRAEEELDDLVNLRAGRLRLAAFPSAGFRLVPDAVVAFRRAHPDVRLSTEVRESSACAELVRNGQLDVAVVFDFATGPLLPAPGLDLRPLTEDVLHVAVPTERASTLEHRDSVSIAELRGDAWIRDGGPDPMCREKLDELCAQAGFRPRVSFESDGYLTVSRLVSAGMGVALVPQLAAEQMEPGVELRRIHPPVVRRVSVLTAATPTPAAEAMRDILTAAATPDPA